MPYPDPDEFPNLMPMHAPDWLWEAWEAHELEWQQWENTFAQVHALPTVLDGRYPARDEYPVEEWSE